MNAKDNDIIYETLIESLKNAQQAGLIIIDWLMSKDVIEVKQENGDGWKQFRLGPNTSINITFMDHKK